MKKKNPEKSSELELSYPYLPFQENSILMPEKDGRHGEQDGGVGSTHPTFPIKRTRGVEGDAWHIS